MLASGIDTDTDAVESGARLAALVAITGFASVSFGNAPDDDEADADCPTPTMTFPPPAP